jgi:hypothetical protein
MSLVEAVQQIEKLFRKIGQHPAPRDAVATSMGYSGLHGASATAISALIKYGLLERVGEDYKLTELAMKIIAPHDPVEKVDAIEIASQNPALFAELLSHFNGDVPGDDLLRSYLIRRGFAAVAVPGVIAAYRDTRELVHRESREYHGGPKTEAAPAAKPNDLFDFTFPKSPAAPPSQGVRPMEGERELMKGLLSKEASFRLFVTGNVGEKEIERLISKLQIDKEILAESGADGSGSPPNEKAGD